MCLPIEEHFGTINNEETLASYDTISNAMTLHGACDATWASDRKERRSMGGVVLMLAGGAVYYRTNLQPTIAQSSSEAEFTTMADAGKASMYIRWILDELEKSQETSTQIIADNQGSIKITSAQQPTRRVRHVEMKHFAILQWTEDQHIKFVYRDSALNYSDSLSKVTGKIKFHQHMNIITGRRQPMYSTIQGHSLVMTIY